MSEKIELQIGVPITLGFRYRAGKLLDKKWPGAEDCYARATDDGRILFVDADTEMRLRKAAPHVGMKVRLTKQETASGGAYLIIQPEPPEIKRPLGVHAGGRDVPAAVIESPADGAPAPEITAPVSTATSQPSTTDSLLVRCLCEAVDAAKTGQAHAAAIGFPLTFTSSDMQGLASTIFIQRCRDGAIVKRVPSRWTSAAITRQKGGVL